MAQVDVDLGLVPARRDRGVVIEERRRPGVIIEEIEGRGAWASVRSFAARGINGGVAAFSECVARRLAR